MTIHAMLFDFDGTLADTIPVCIKAYQEAFHTLTGQNYSDEEIQSLFGPNEEGIFRRMLGDQWQTALDIYHAAYKRLHPLCNAPFPGISAALDLLKQRGVSLAVVTGKGAYSADYSLDYLGIARYFDIVEAGKPEGIVKAKAIREILHTWQIPPEQAAYIGDADYDIREAIEARVLPLGACWSRYSTITQQPAVQSTLTFVTVQAFLAWLESNI